MKLGFTNIRIKVIELIVVYFFVALEPTTSFASDQFVNIEKNLASPQWYQLHTVTLRGTVRNVQPYPPRFIYNCGWDMSSYTFVLDDGTGSMDIHVNGLCGRPAIAIPIQSGDRVTVQAVISVFPEMQTGTDHQIVRATATRLMPLLE